MRGLSGTTDTQFVEKFGEICGAIVGSSVDIEELYCINRERGLFRVGIKDKSAKQDILQNAKKLKGHNRFGGIFVSRDLTFIQRQELRQRREASRSGPPRRPPSFILGTGQTPTGLQRRFRPTVGEASSAHALIDHIVSGAESPEDQRSFSGFP